MATDTGRPTVPPGERGVVDRVRHLVRQATPAFAVGALVVPLALYAVVVALDTPKGAFYVHVASGATWFGFAVALPAVVGPTVGRLDDDATRQVLATLVPRSVFLLVGVSTTTVFSGTSLLYGFGRFSGSPVWTTAALALGWGLWTVVLSVVVPLHLRAYYESQTPSPDADRLARVRRWTLVVGVVQVALLLVVVYVMAGLRLG